MSVCPRCGSTAKPDATVCGDCGAQLGPSAPRNPSPGPIPAAGAASMKRTLMGMSPFGSTPPPAGSANSNPAATAASNAQQPAAPPGANQPAAASSANQPAAPPTGAAAMKRTLVGMAPVSTPPPGGTISSTPPPGGTSSYPPPIAGAGGMKRTLVGMAPVSTPPPAGVIVAPVPGAPPAAAAPGGAAVPPLQKTMLGVARPGIAPLAPGVPKDSPRGGMQAAAHFTGTDGHTVGVSGGPMGASGGTMPGAGGTVAVGFAPDVGHRHGERRRSSAPPPPPPSTSSATIAISSGLLLAAGAVAFAVFWRSPAPLRAEARVDASGADLLHVTCATCPDGTEVRAGDSKAQVTSHAADLVLASSLRVGENQFSVGIDRPGSGRDETVALIVQIGYRIRPDLSALDNERPLLRVAIEGAPAASMTIDGKPLTLGGDGKGLYDVDIASECTGLSDETKTIERAVPYSVVGSSGGSEQGTVNVRVAVVPLHIDAPTVRSIIEKETFVLAGRTARGARLVAGDRAIAVAADGTFSQALPAPRVGENSVKVRVSVPGQAPRTAAVSVRRVEHLADEAKTFTAKAPLPFGDLAASINQYIGQPVVLSGEIVDSRAQGATNLALLDVQKGCSRPPCLARLVFAGEDPVPRGERLQIYGYVTRPISPGGDTAGTVPEVEVAFAQKRQ